jgi:hypothetical protein
VPALVSSALRYRGAIEAAILRYDPGASFGYTFGQHSARLFFTLASVSYVLDVTLPDPADAKFLYTAAKRQQRSEAEVAKLYEAAVAARWRAFADLIEAKFEAVGRGIVTIRDEFGPYALQHNLVLVPATAGSAELPPGASRAP